MYILTAGTKNPPAVRTPSPPPPPQISLHTSNSDKKISHPLTRSWGKAGLGNRSIVFDYIHFNPSPSSTTSLPKSKPQWKGSKRHRRRRRPYVYSKNAPSMLLDWIHVFMPTQCDAMQCSALLRHHSVTCGNPLPTHTRTPRVWQRIMLFPSFPSFSRPYHPRNNVLTHVVLYLIPRCHRTHKPALTHVQRKKRVSKLPAPTSLPTSVPARKMPPLECTQNPHPQITQ